MAKKQSGISNVAKDPRLGRLISFDDRSKNFPIMSLLPLKAEYKPRSYTWRCNVVLDQGQEGSCVGHGWAHELAARPVAVKGVTHPLAVKIYKLAQTIDEWPGENYEGTSVLAGVKALKQMYPKSIDHYRWAFGLDEVVATIGYFGPVVLGVNWYSGMFNTDADGFIHVKGQIAGGHCLIARAVDVKKKTITLHNSWGASWGVNGTAKISFADLKRLLNESGDACVPVGRHNIIVA